LASGAGGGPVPGAFAFSVPERPVVTPFGPADGSLEA
jgi:hypothetical protein